MSITMSNIPLYEELRQAIDGGSESMTHEDAIKAVKYWQAEIDELRASLQERDAVYDLMESKGEYIKTLEATLQQALNALQYHTQQTRPIHNTDLAITAIQEVL